MTAVEAPPRATSPNPRVVFASAIVAVAGLIACVVALVVGGGAQAIIVSGLPNPGSGTVWGAPLANLLVILSSVVTVGCLLAATWLVPSYTGNLGQATRNLMLLASA